MAQAKPLKIVLLSELGEEEAVSVLEDRARQSESQDNVGLGVEKTNSDNSKGTSTCIFFKLRKNNTSKPGFYYIFLLKACVTLTWFSILGFC